MLEVYEYNYHLLTKLSIILFLVSQLGLAISMHLYNALLRVNFMHQVHGYNHHLSAKLSVFIRYLFFTFMIGLSNLSIPL